jgi:3-methyl-2-oxobutanoate hydroxymethyltransferase
MGMKRSGRKITMLTSYQTQDARLVDKAGVDVILVGDSGGMVLLEYPDTTHVTMDDMLWMTSSVAKANTRALVVGDMPIHSYDTPEDALANAKRFKEAGADVVKLEGGVEMKEIVKAIVAAGIPVMGHIAHTPQTEVKHRIEGKTAEEEVRLLADAKALEEAGAFAIVIELADSAVSKNITKSVKVPTIGIGAGPHTDGQVLVLDDLIGLTDPSKFPSGRMPKFVGQWPKEPAVAVLQFIEKVRNGTFPGPNESYSVIQR